MTIAAQCAALTHKGVVRSANQDAVVQSGPVFAVADGMGGHAAGDIASQVAARHLDTFAGAAVVDGESVLAACRAANAEILHRARQDADLTGMGTTIAGIALVRTATGDGVLAFNAGDSRVYLLTSGALVQVSDDHSLVAEMVEAQEITPAEALVHPQRNVVTRGLGITDHVAVDSWVVPVGEEPARFLICSDGLTNELSDRELLDALTADVPVQGAADRLMRAALSRGARDNVSVVVVDVTSTPDPTAADTLNDADTEPRGFAVIGLGDEEAS